MDVVVAIALGLLAFWTLQVLVIGIVVVVLAVTWRRTRDLSTVRGPASAGADIVPPQATGPVMAPPSPGASSPSGAASALAAPSSR